MKFKTTFEKTECEKIREALGEWVAENDFNLFGTATYINAHTITRRKAHTDAAHFMRLLSRKVLGKHKVDREKIYLPALVFVEKGKNRDRTHIHWFTKGYTLKHTKDIIVNADRLWKAKIEKAMDVMILDEVEAQRRTYTIKEQQAFDAEIISPKACYLTLS
jgi:hypothetical protein